MPWAPPNSKKDELVHKIIMIFVNVIVIDVLDSSDAAQLRDAGLAAAKLVVRPATRCRPPLLLSSQCEPRGRSVAWCRLRCCQVCVAGFDA